MFQCKVLIGLNCLAPRLNDVDDCVCLPFEHTGSVIKLNGRYECSLFKHPYFFAFSSKFF